MFLFPRHVEAAASYKRVPLKMYRLSGAFLLCCISSSAMQTGLS